MRPAEAGQVYVYEDCVLLALRKWNTEPDAWEVLVLQCACGSADCAGRVKDVSSSALAYGKRLEDLP